MYSACPQRAGYSSHTPSSTVRARKRAQMQLYSSPLSVSKRHREDARSSGQSCQQRNGTGCGDSGGSSSSGCSKRIRFKLASDECETVPLGAWQANPIPLPLAESTAGGSCAGQRRKWQRLLLQQQLRLLECDGVSWCWVPALGLATAERERQLLLPLFSSVPPVPHAPLLDACPGRTVTGDHRAAEGEQQAKQCCDPDAPLPAKHTIGGQRYAVSQPNPRWDVRAAAAAAAAAAAELGVSVKARQPGSRRAKAAATAAAEHLAAPAAGGGSCSALQPAATASGEHGHCSEGGSSSSSTLPTSTATARFIVLMLAHETGAPAAAAWDAWEQAQGGAAAVLVHLKAGVELDEQQLPGCTWLRGRLLRSRTRSMWGDLSLTAAMLGACAEVLRHCPCACHVAVVSGLCVPAAPAPRLPAAVSLVGCFRFGRDFDAAAGRIAATLLRQDEPGIKPADDDAWQDSMICTATWMVMSRCVSFFGVAGGVRVCHSGSHMAPHLLCHTATYTKPTSQLANY